MNTNRTAAWILKAAALTMFLSVGCGRMFAQYYVWDSVHPEEWNIAKDSTKGYVDAVVIFDKELQEDYRGEPRLTVHKRIRILSAEGRKYGDVDITYNDERHSISWVQARAVLPDGTRFELPDDHVKTQIVAQGGDYHYKKTSFSIPGVTDNCVIEYRYVEEGGPSIWMIQQDIPVMHAEFHWKPFLSSAWSGYSESIGSPSWQWWNDAGNGKTSYEPQGKNWKDVTFSMDNVPPFKTEPRMGSAFALHTVLMAYYSLSDDPQSFWNDDIKIRQKGIRDFCRWDDILLDTMKTWPTFTSDAQKVAFASTWIQAKVRNAEDPVEKSRLDKIKKMGSINDIMRNGYATVNQICIMFRYILQKLGVTSYLAYGQINTSLPFIKTAMFKQFDVSLVALPVGAGHYQIFASGSSTTQMGKVPYGMEGTTCMVSVNDTAQFVELPYSSIDSNRIQRTYTMKLLEDGTCRGDFTEHRIGLNAVAMRAILTDAAQGQRSIAYQNRMQAGFTGLEVDSLTATGVEDIYAPVDVRGNVRFPCVVQPAGTRLIVQPLSGQVPSDEIFSASVRQHPVVFGYAYEVIEEYNISLPPGYVVESAPVDTTTQNLVGLCRYQSSSHDSTLSIRKITQLYFPVIDVPRYNDVREFFTKTIGTFDRMSIVLNQRSALQPVVQSAPTPSEQIPAKPSKKSTGKKSAIKKP